MYKTIRHGENSLQYTILPQNDDFRIEGKCAAGSGSGSGTGSSRSANRRPKRRSFFAYLGLIFVCTVIVGAVLIPFLVSAECLPIPTDWLMKTKAALAGSVGSGSGGGGELKDARHLSVHGEGMSRVGGGPIGHGVNVGKSVKIINRGSSEKIVLRVNKTVDNTTAAMAPTVQQQQQQPQSAQPPQAQMSHVINDANEIVTNKDENSFDNSNQNQNVAVESTVSGIGGGNQKLLASANEHFVAEIRFDDIGMSSNGGGGGGSAMNSVVPTIVVTTIRNSNGGYGGTGGTGGAINSNQNDALQLQQLTQTPTNQQMPQQEMNLISNGNDVGGVRGGVRPTQSVATAVATAVTRSPPNRIVYQNSGPPPTPTTMLASRIMQVPLLKSTSKKPNIPPALVSNQLSSNANSNAAPTATANSNGDSSSNNNHANSIPSNQSLSSLGGRVTTNGKTDWMQTHWPYIDPSTYFQWTGYKAEDSVLLPLLLGFALIGMILVIMVCLVARKRTIVSSVRKRNRNDVEEQGTEDNATLLTATSLSDDD